MLVLLSIKLKSGGLNDLLSALEIEPKLCVRIRSIRILERICVFTEKKINLRGPDKLVSEE